MAALSWVPGAETHSPLHLIQGSEDAVMLLLSWQRCTENTQKHKDLSQAANSSPGSGLHTVPTPSAEALGKGLTSEEQANVRITHASQAKEHPSWYASWAYVRQPGLERGSDALPGRELAAHKMKLEQINGQQPH